MFDFVPPYPPYTLIPKFISGKLTWPQKILEVSSDSPPLFLGNNAMSLNIEEMHLDSKPGFSSSNNFEFNDKIYNFWNVIAKTAISWFGWEWPPKEKFSEKNRELETVASSMTDNKIRRYEKIATTLTHWTWIRRRIGHLHVMQFYQSNQN